LITQARLELKKQTWPELLVRALYVEQNGSSNRRREKERARERANRLGFFHFGRVLYFRLKNCAQKSNVNTI